MWGQLEGQPAHHGSSPATRGDFRARKHVEWFLAEPAGGELHLESLFAEAAFLNPADAAVRIAHEDDRLLGARAFAALRSRIDAFTMQPETA